MGSQDLRETYRAWLLVRRSVLLSGLALACIGQPGWAELSSPFSSAPREVAKSNPLPEQEAQTDTAPQVTPTPPTIDDLEPPATSVTEWMAQIEDSLVQITGVRVEPTEAGLQVILETPEGISVAPAKRVEGNSLVFDIPNARLDLADETAAEQPSPIAGIDAIRVTALPENQVRVAIIGTNAPPTADLQTEGQNLVININSGTEVANDSEEELEITVTATRTETASQDVPQSIQSIPQEVIENRETNSLTELLRSFPGVISSAGTREQFNDVLIRGFVADTRRNGLRESNANQSGVPLANVERVEVLKGPASVLYGQGSFGGTVNVITKQPTDEPFYKIEAAAGNFDLYRGAADLSGPLNDSKTLKYRLNIAAETEGSFVDFYDRQRFQIAPVLSWDINDKTDITFEAEYSYYSSNTDIGLPARGTILDNPNGKIPRSRFVPDPEKDRDETEYLLLSYRLEHRFSDGWKIRNAFQFTNRSNLGVLTFPTNLQEDGRTLELISSNPAGRFNVADYLLDTYIVGNFNTGSIEHELVAGIELNRQTLGGEPFGEAERSPIDLFNPDYTNIIVQPPEEIFEDRTVNQTLGIYLQDKVGILDNLTLLVGGRFDLVGTKFEDLIANTSESQKQTEFSPRVGIVYKPIPNLSLYASYSRSFLPTFFARNREGEFFEPQRGTQFEIGTKAELGEKMSVNLAYFDTTITNVLTEDLSDPFFSTQTGKQNSKGVEISASGEILPGWSIFGGYVYNDAKITDDNTIPVGNRINNVPRHAVSFSTNYEIQQGKLKGLGAGLGFYFVSDRQGDLENTFTVPSYLRTDASIFYRRDSFKVALNVRNLFDIDYFETAQGNLRVRPGEPFTVIGSVSFEF